MRQMSRPFLSFLIGILVLPISIFAQNNPVNVSGQVTDESNLPVTGVSIKLKGTSAGTLTDNAGNYRLTMPADRAKDGILVYTMVGYTELEVAINNQLSINAVLQSTAQSLNSVVVVGYGTQKKATLTGAISEIRTADLAKNAVADISNSIAGRLSGVVAVQNTGKVGEDGAALFIRGPSTFNDNSPLVLVDGVQRDFNFIDPNTIESMSVLKDASATAVYGVRGANGVILITTKRGTESKPVISYSGYYGLQNPIRIPRFLNSYDYARFYNEAQMNDDPSLTPDDLTYSPEDIQKYLDGSDPFNFPSVNWNEERLRNNSPMHRQSISMSGGSKTVKYYTAFGLLDQNGAIPNNFFRTYNIRSNIDADITKSTRISLNLAGIREATHFPGMQGQAVEQGIFSSIPPNAFPIRWEDGSFATRNGGNPVGDLTETGYRNRWNNTLQSSIVLDQKLDFITQGLAVKILGAYDAGFSREKQWLIPYPTYIKTSDGYEQVSDDKKPTLFENFGQIRNTTFEGHITYNRTFNRHNFAGLLLYTQTAFYEEGFNAGRLLYNSAAIDQLFAGPVLNATNGGAASESGREGYVGRITYGYDGKYLVEANFGYNGSENFPTTRRYGFFPSASVGWVISGEDFLAQSKVVSFLKVRASYGEVGNDKIGGRRFLYQQPFLYGSGYVFGGNSPVPVQSIYGGGLANPNVTWERARKTNIGIDAQLLDQKFDVKLDIFFEKRDNILATRNQSVPTTFGAELPVENIAKVNNSGFEVEVMHRNQVGQFRYSIGGNFTFARNKVMFIDEPENIPAWQRSTGQPIGQIFGYVAEGLYLNKGQVDNHPKFEAIDPDLGDIMYKDINNDNVINDLDRTAIGFPRTPQIIYGINLGASFKGFDLSSLIQGAGRSSVYFADEAAWEFLFGANPLETIKGRYDGVNPNPTYPRLSLNRSQYKKETSTYWIRNAAYWRLKNIELGYTFPDAFLARHRIQTLRIYVAGTNLFTQSKFKDWDPESPGGASYYFPQMKVTSFGVNLTF